VRRARRASACERGRMRPVCEFVGRIPTDSGSGCVFSGLRPRGECSVAPELLPRDRSVARSGFSLVTSSG
jgi:hypothetical protein